MASKKVARKKKIARKVAAPGHQWPPPQVIERYAKLGPDAQTVAIALAAWGFEVTPHDLFQFLLENDAHTSAGKLFTLSHVRAAIKDLIAAGWAEYSPGARVYLEESISNPVLEIAARNHRLRPLSASLLSARSNLLRRYAYDFTRPGQAIINRARLAYFLHDWKLLDAIDQGENRDHGGQRPLYNLFLFLSPSPYKLLYDRLPQKHQANAIFQVCYNIARVQSPVGDLLPAARQVAFDYPHSGFFYTELLTFRGDIDGLESIRHEIESRGPSGAALIETRVMAAVAAFLRGDDEAAIACFGEALATARASSRKRKVFFSGFAGVLYLVALIRSGTPERLAEAHSLAKAGVELKQSSWYRSLGELHEALGEFAGMTGRRDELADDAWQVAPPGDLLAVGWRELWTGAVEPPDMERFDRLMFDAEIAAENGYRWLAAELYELAARFGSEPHAGEAAGKAAALRASISPALLSAADAIQPRERWEETLLGIELIASRTAQAGKGRGGSTPTDGRLAWVIQYNPERPSSWGLTPVEQKVGKSGNWNKPRAIALKRLSENPPDFTTLQDRRAAAQVAREQSWGSTPNLYLKVDRATLQLVGHPLLFLDEELTQPVELARRETQLILQPAGKDEIYLRLDPPMPPGQSVILTRDSPTRLFVTETTPAARKLHELFGADGITLPAAAKERVLKAASALAGEIHVQSQIGGEDLVAATSVSADATPQLHLVPHGIGLSAEILAQPIPDTGSHYQPGEGGETVFARGADGANLKATRNLEDENARAQAAIAACPTLSGSERVSPFRWALADPIACLELLTELRRLAPGALTVHWPKGETFKLKGEAETKQLRMALKSEQNWFRASGELKVDDDLVLNMHQLLELVDGDAGTGRFVKLADGQFLALTEEFRRRLEELKAYSSPAPGKDGDLQINELAAYALEDLTANVQLEADKKWRDHVARLETAESFEPEVPRALRAELRPYQLDGYRWLAKLANWGVGACLADDMGLGKTVQALALLLHRAKGGPALVIAPTSVATNWMREAARFAPTLNVQQFGPGDRAVTLTDLRAFDLIVCTFGLMQIENGLLAAIDWHTVIIDEAQAIKNAATKRAKAAMNLRAGFRLITTGTPIENNLGELHTLFQFINPGLLGSAQKFHRRFADPIQKTGNAQSRRWLKKLISPFILRRLKGDVLDDLPPRTEIVLSVEMSEEETAFYEAIRQRAVANLETQDAAAGERGIRILAEITRLRRACCNPSLVAKGAPAPASSKLATFAETLESLLEADHKVLVFSQFVDHLSILRDHLETQQVAYQYLDGSTPPKRRQQAIDAFQSGDGDVFLISLKAGGTGLNLTAADYVIHMDPWWNPASEDQASDRAHRIGQLRPVTVYRLVTKGTIEEKIVALHHEKRDLASSLLEGTDTGRSLNPEELLALIRG